MNTGEKNIKLDDSPHRVAIADKPARADASVLPRDIALGQEVAQISSRDTETESEQISLA